MRADGQDSWRPAPVPETNSLAKVAAAAKECTACPLYKKATQTVFGEGPKHAAMFMIGEQPGDYEDVAGKPFVGPAGKILDRALEEAGINRDEVYVTRKNAAKFYRRISRQKLWQLFTLPRSCVSRMKNRANGNTLALLLTSAWR